MIITLQRMFTVNKSCIGLLEVDGKQYFTLEDKRKFTGIENKVYGETRIPAGIYEINPQEAGHIYRAYIKRWPDWHRGVLMLQQVEGFSGICLHAGNTDKDTKGCPLVGNSCDLRSAAIYQSRAAYIPLYRYVIEAAYAGDLKIEVRDES